MKCSCGVCALKFNLDNLQVVGHSLGCALCYSSGTLQRPALAKSLQKTCTTKTSLNLLVKIHGDYAFFISSQLLHVFSVHMYHPCNRATELPTVKSYGFPLPMVAWYYNSTGAEGLPLMWALHGELPGTMEGVGGKKKKDMAVEKEIRLKPRMW